FELDNISTFSAEDKLVDYHMVKLNDGAEALVCMFDKQSLEKTLEELSHVNLDPRFVTFSPFAFSTINGYLSYERPILLIDLGERQFNFSLFDENGLRRVRSSNNTIDNIKNLLAVDSLDFSYIQNNEVIKSEFIKLVDLIVDEIKKTAHYFETDLKRPVKSFILSGDICTISQIENIIAEKLKSDVKRVFIPQLGSKDSPFFVKPYSLALYGSSIGKAEFNLRTGDYKYQNKGFDLKRTFLLPATLLAILLLISLFQKTTEYLSARKEISFLNTEIQKEITSSFPNVSKLPDPVLFINSQLKEVQNKLNVIQEVKGDLAPLDVINEISSSIPQNLEMYIDEVRFESAKSVKVWGRCDSYNEIASIEKALSESGKFKFVERDQVSRAVNNTIKFVMALALK
ncbi:MAG: hypothetical protein ACRENO_09760, partial [Thermodesulfobacteriota bacterium]